MTIEIGKILKPQGIRGEVKLLPLTDDLSRFRSLKYLIVRGQAKPVLSLRITGEYVYVKLDGIFDRNQAEELRDEYVSVNRSDSVKLSEGRHFIVDLIGCEVYAEGEYIGKLTDVIQNTKTDVYELEGKKGQIMFPVVDDLILSTDTDGKRIEVDKKRLEEVIVYED